MSLSPERKFTAVTYNVRYRLPMWCCRIYSSLFSKKKGAFILRQKIPEYDHSGSNVCALLRTQVYLRHIQFSKSKHGPTITDAETKIHLWLLWSCRGRCMVIYCLLLQTMSVHYRDLPYFKHWTFFSFKKFVICENNKRISHLWSVHTWY